MPYQLDALEGREGCLSAVVVADLEGGRRRLEADALLLFFGLPADLRPLARWGFDLERQQIAVEPSSCATNIPGIFAIGDIAAYSGKLKLILTGFAEAAQACHAAHALVHPGQALHFEHSTSRGLPATG